MQQTAGSYARVYGNVKKEVVDLTKEMIKAGLWKRGVSHEDKAIMMGLWIQKAAQAYGMKAPKFYFVGGRDGEEGYKETGGGCYVPALHEIYLFKKASLTTLLHEFRHAVQHAKRVKKYRDDFEEDARAWSCSLYKTAAPKSYKRACEKGLLRFT